MELRVRTAAAAVALVTVLAGCSPQPPQESRPEPSGQASAPAAPGGGTDGGPDEPAGSPGSGAGSSADHDTPVSSEPDPTPGDAPPTSTPGEGGEPAPDGPPAASPPAPEPTAAPAEPGGAGAAAPPPDAPASGSPERAAPARPPAADADGVLRRGESGPSVERLQRRLDELGYWTGGNDGTFGPLTEQAVLALQKAAGLARDGVAGPRTLAALERGVRPAARSTAGRVLEVDLERQLLLVVDDGRVTRTFATSTGTGEYYVHDGRRHLADTPTGRFRITRQIDGLRVSPLGRLWRPKYFHGGIAVHGSTSVPAYPASHGCVRLTNAAMDWVWVSGAAPVGTAVWVY